MKEPINWEFEFWTQRDENLAAIRGIDSKGNEFVATCYYSYGEFENIENIEEV